MCDKNKHGQALIEFVLVLPVLIFMILALVDISRLMIMKTHLESLLAGVDQSTVRIEDKEYDVSVERKDDFITLKSCIEVFTPGLGKVLGKPACSEVSKELKREG